MTEVSVDFARTLVNGFYFSHDSVYTWMMENMISFDGSKFKSPQEIQELIGMGILQQFYAAARDCGGLAARIISNEYKGYTNDKIINLRILVQRLISGIQEHFLEVDPIHNPQLEKAALTGDDATVLKQLEHASKETIEFAITASEAISPESGVGGHTLLANYLRAAVADRVKPSLNVHIVQVLDDDVVEVAKKAIDATDLAELSTCVDILSGNPRALSTLCVACAFVGFDEGIRVVAMALQASGTQLPAEAFDAAMSTENGSKAHTFAGMYITALIGGLSAKVPLKYLTFLENA